jgi:hypothetical protein
LAKTGQQATPLPARLLQKPRRLKAWKTATCFSRPSPKVQSVTRPVEAAKSAVPELSTSPEETH